MSLHHNKKKEKRTIKLLERVLENMIERGDNDFSYVNVIKLMQEEATNEEKEIPRIVIKSTSTICKNNTYKKMINDAKKTLQKATEIGIEHDMSFNLSEHELKVKIASLLRENNILSDEILCLKELITELENEQNLLNTENVVNRNVSDVQREDYDLKKILKDLLEILMQNHLAYYKDYSSRDRWLVIDTLLDGEVKFADLQLCQYLHIKK